MSSRCIHGVVEYNPSEQDDALSQASPLVDVGLDIDDIPPAPHVDGDPSDESAAATGLQLSPFEARVLGSLMEKALTTPQNYPLSINALVTACNQTTNRDPVAAYGETEVAGLLPTLKERRLMRFVHPTSGRGVTKYRHVLHETLSLDDDELALLSVLLVRGPQTSGELRTRTDRMAEFTSGSEIEDRLASMCDPDGNRLALRLEREPGHREPRWVQTLCVEQGTDRAGQPATNPRVAATSPAVIEEVAALRAELSALRQEFEQFRSEFG